MSTKEEYQRLKHRCIQDNICLRCRKSRESSHSKWYCLNCLEINKRHDAAKRARKSQAGLCQCGGKPVNGMKSCEQCLQRGKEYQATRREEHLLAGSCITCGKPPIPNTVTCHGCSQRAANATLHRYNTNKNNQVCPFCAGPLSDKFRCDRCHNNHLYNSRSQWLSRRSLVIEHYGGSCQCCQCNDYRFLEIDHMNGDGSKHRAEVVGSHIVSWIINNGYPEDFQILCANCNRGKGKFGICPHNQAPLLPASSAAKSLRRQRIECIDHYGGKCVFCNESNWAFLEFDHINDDGRFNRHAKMPKWLIENGFPADIQLLCSNCNKAKALYGHNPLATH